MKTICPRCRININSSGDRCPSCGQFLAKSREKSPLILILLGLLVYLAFAGTACVGLYKYFADNGWKPLLYGFASDRPYEVSVAPPSVRVPGTLKPTFTFEECKVFRDLFEQRRFDSLNKAASKIQFAFERDSSYEHRACDFYDIFDSSLPGNEELLNAWVAHSPRHFAPYLARAQYYYSRGGESRGYKYASETSEKQFAGMEAFFQKAEMDVNSALAINPRLLLAHILRISMFNVYGEENEESAAFYAARQYFPDSYLLYKTIIWAKRPRWGGSYAEMEKIAMEARDYFRVKPEFYTLFGEIYDDQALEAEESEQYDKAVDMYSKAIRYGDDYQFFEKRARVYCDLEKLDKALDDANRSIALRPRAPRLYGLRATIYLCKNDPDTVVRETRSMESMFPGNSEVREWKERTAGLSLDRGHCLFRTDQERAVVWYGLAIEIEPEFAEAYHWRGVAQWNLKKVDLAYSDLKQAIRLAPRDLKSYQMMDSLLASQGRWDEIIEYWSRFLSLDPNNGDAYLERAGAKRHKGEMQSALVDLKTACSLGNKEACSIMQQYR